MNWVEDFFDLMKNTILQSVQDHASVMVTMTGVILICALLRHFETGGMGKGISKSAFLVEYAVIALMIGQTILYAKETAQEAMNHMVTALNTVSPVLLMSTHGIATEVVANLFHLLFLPATCMLAALTLVDNLSSAFSISHLVDFFKKAVFWGLGLVMTVYLGMMSVQSYLVTSEGTVAQKTAKFAVGAWPIVGQFLAESFDAVSASATVIHTTTGTGAMIAILTICIAPALELLLLAGMLKLVSALTQPIAEKRICNCIGGAASSISLMAGLIAVCAVMLTITIGLFLAAIHRVKGG